MVETSVVIRSFNESEFIGDVLEAVLDQRYQDYEIILVDSGSTDGTLEIAESYVDKIEFVAPHDFTFGHSCNVGCEVADGRFVSFLSAHAIPTDEEWLETLVENLREDESVAMTYSNQMGASENKFPERRLFDQLFGDRRRRQEPPDYFANNASSAIRRDLWEEHSFDEYLTGHEDIEWAKYFMDRGFFVIYEPDACIYHIHDETWKQVYNRFEREAIADVDIGIRDRSDRWREYGEIPLDIAGDVVAAIRQRKLDLNTLSEIIRFRTYQHLGTAAGLKSDLDLDSNRFEYFYGGANERVVIDEHGNASLERSPLPEIKPNDVLIRTDYIGVSVRDRNTDHVAKGQYPVVPGRNYVGTVIDLGANADSVDVGDVVVGETRFDCGVCEACSNGNNDGCVNPIRLGVDTSDGAYSRFLAVPSDHVHPLPDEVDSPVGAVAGTVARILDGVSISRHPGLDPPHCLIVGRNPTAELTAQILRIEGASVERIDAPPITVGPAIESADLFIDATGDTEIVDALLTSTFPGSSILLLGDEYGEFTVSYEAMKDKTVIDVSGDGATDFVPAIEALSALETDTILDGTYPLVEFETAWKAAEERGRFPLISIRDVASGEVPSGRRRGQ